MSDFRAGGVRKIYVASSWRNPRQPAIVAALREAGHEVYDFRNPAPGDDGFSWKETDPRPPAEWSAVEFREILQHPVAQHGFGLDMGALRWCDTCVLALPCGRSAHLELGWATGAGKQTIVLCEKLDEPELMYLMCDLIAVTLDEVLAALVPPSAPRAARVRCVPPIPGLNIGEDCCLAFGDHVLEPPTEQCCEHHPAPLVPKQSAA